MEDYTGYETVKEQLILAGISELQQHSAKDLSLRKVAALCNVSCAAPYKHFKNKQDFLNEIMLYIDTQWTRLRRQICLAYPDDLRRQAVEVCLAYIQFCLANPNFRNILVMQRGADGEGHPQPDFYGSKDDNLIRKYCTQAAHGDAETAEQNTLRIHSLVYGTIYMLDHGQLQNTPETLDRIRHIFEDAFQPF